jgi:2-dehydro-3-deoxygalactonokinase
MDPSFEGTVCLPGTHSKWVRIESGGVIESFQTFMTGELFDLIAGRSVLRHSVAGEDDWNDDAFDEAIMSAVADPVSISSKLFSLRAESLLHECSGSVARSRLSGWLIGQELAAARDWWREPRRNVGIVGARRLSAIYDRALRSLGVESQLKEIESMTLAGLHSAIRGRL